MVAEILDTSVANFDNLTADCMKISDNRMKKSRPAGSRPRIVDILDACLRRENEPAHDELVLFGSTRLPYFNTALSQISASVRLGGRRKFRRVGSGREGRFVSINVDENVSLFHFFQEV